MTEKGRGAVPAVQNTNKLATHAAKAPCTARGAALAALTLSLLIGEVLFLGRRLHEQHDYRRRTARGT